MNIQQLRTQIAALQDATMDENKNFRSAYDEGKFDALSAVDALLDSLQEEPVKDRFVFKAIPRLLDMIEPTDKAKSYVTKLADAFDSEGYYTDAKIVRESLKIMNGEKVPMATMDEEPVRDELEEAASYFARKDSKEIINPANFYYTVADKARVFKAGAQWQKEQMMSKAIDAVVVVDRIGEATFLCPHTKATSDKAKVIIIEED